MIAAELNEQGSITLDSDYPLRDRDRIKQLPGARHISGRWTAPLTWATCVQLRGVFGEELQVGPELTQWSIEHWHKAIGPAMALRTDLELSGPDSVLESWRGDGKAKGDLYPFQEAGVKFMTTARKLYLCDEMGTGKTIQTASSLRYLAETGENPFPAMVVVKASLIRGWQQELADWLPGAKVVVVTGSAAKRRILLNTPADVYIMSYTTIRMHSRLAPYGPIRLRRCHVCDSSLKDTKEWPQTRCEHCKKELNKRPWKTIIVDEAHMLQNPKAKQTRAVWALNTEETKNVWLLTGTPVSNDPQNMWTGLHLIDPVSFSNHSKFVDRYCAIGFNPFGGTKILGLGHEHKEEFFKIIDPVMRRMPKEAVLPFLPKKTYIKRYLEMTPKQATAYQQMKNGMIAVLEGSGAVVAGDPLTQTTRLEQLANAFLEEQSDGSYKMIAPSNKVDGVFDLLEDMGDEPLVVMAGGPGSAQLIYLLAEAMEKEKIPYSKIVAGMNPDQIHKAQTDFQAGRVRVCMATTGVGGVGLNLTRSSTVCFMQRPWSHIQSSQAEDRIHRIGSEIHDKITIVDLISAGTIEEKRLTVLGEKAERQEEVVRDKQFLLWLLGDEK